MATKFTIATFNVENLFIRYNFRGKKIKIGNKTTYKAYSAKELKEAVKDGFIRDPKIITRNFEPLRKLTAKTLKAVKADIVGLQEVEGLDTLKTFNARYLNGKYKYKIVIDGNDPRFIDVGLLSKFPIEYIRSHQFERSGRSYVFSRDCLEVHLNIGGKPLVVFVNHLKSMMGGRGNTRKRRDLQSKNIIRILKERFGENYGSRDFIILGDLNDYLDPAMPAESGIRRLLESNQMENVIERLPASDRWTHYYKGDKSYHQLDYILISNALKSKNKTVKPTIERRGQPRRAKRVTTFFPEVVGKKKASDHCPVAITLTI